MALEVLSRCNKYDEYITQDLLLREIKIFYNRTALDLAVEGEAYEFLAQSSVQSLLTDIWYERINPTVSNWKVILMRLSVDIIFILSFLTVYY
jgi:hypothetical protein